MTMRLKQRGAGRSIYATRRRKSGAEGVTRAVMIRARARAIKKRL
jgi:hypothetical protein